MDAYNYIVPGVTDYAIDSAKNIQKKIEQIHNVKLIRLMNNRIGALLHFVAVFTFIMFPLYGRIPSWSKLGKEIAYTHTFSYIGIILIHTIVFFFLCLKVRKCPYYIEKRGTSSYLN
jgi:hypothetical protein